MIKNIDVIVMSGGYGTRFGPLAGVFGCKSLIPVGGTQVIEYVLEAVSGVIGNGHIFLCVERAELVKQISDAAQKLNHGNIEVYLDPAMRGTMHAVYKLRGRVQTDHVLVLYGHHPVPREHLVALRDSPCMGVEVGLYTTSSNNPRSFADVTVEDSRLTKITRGDDKTKLRSNQYYIDVPYRLPRLFMDWLQDRGIRCHEVIKDWLELGNVVCGHHADFPHEFHYPSELGPLTSFVRQLRH